MIKKVYLKIKQMLASNKMLVINITGAVAIKGASLLLSVVTLPAYMRYFDNNAILGLWFTIISLINWVNMCDLGIGHGLRNKLTEALTYKDNKASKDYISSTYIVIGFLSILLMSVFFILSHYINWNNVLSIETAILDNETIELSMNIVFAGFFIQFFLRLVTSVLYAMQKSMIVDLLGLVTSVITVLYLIITPRSSAAVDFIRLSYVQLIATNLPLLLANIVIFSTRLKEVRPSFRQFDLSKIKEVMNIGVQLLWLQVAFLIVMGMHAVLIMKMVSSEAVVEFQIYNKIYHTVASVLSLAMVPIWSATTKELVKKNYVWISKVNAILVIMSMAVGIVGFMMIPLLQSVVNIWLGDKAITVSSINVIVMTLYCVIYVWHNANTSISNGMSYFKVQMIGMTIAAIAMLPLSMLFCKLMGGWIGIILGSCVSIVPYEISQTYFTQKKLKSYILHCK